MSFQEFERKYYYLLSWKDAEKKVGRRLDWNNNFDCCLYHDLLVEAVNACFFGLERKGNYMRDSHKELVIKTAIQEYKNSVLFGFSSSTAHAINMMEEAYYMCSAYNIKGIAELKETIKEAKEKYKNELGN